MSSTSEGQRKLFLTEIKLLGPSFNIKFNEIRLKEVKSIKIQASWPFKFKLEIESEKLIICSCCNRYIEIVPIYILKSIQIKFVAHFLSNFI